MPISHVPSDLHSPLDHLHSEEETHPVFPQSASAPLRASRPWNGAYLDLGEPEASIVGGIYHIALGHVVIRTEIRFLRRGDHNTYRQGYLATPAELEKVSNLTH